MCFHSRQSKKAQQLEKRFNARIEQLDLFNPEEFINGFTFPQTPVITNSDSDIIKHFNWGLIPHWAKDDSIKKYTLNAKIETLKEKPSFKNSVNKRCLILADGFYEWQWLDPKGKNKQKYLITLPNNEAFAFGGIWSEWINENGATINSYSIVTTEANELMSKIHNSKKRMPVILSPENENSWLRGEGFDSFKRVDLALKAVKAE